MGDEFDVSGAIVFANGESVPLDELRSVEFDGGETACQRESWSGEFSMAAEAVLDLGDAVARTDQNVYSFVIEMDRLVPVAFTGASRFMRSRRMWQCRRGRGNANVERRKLSRKRRHIELCKRMLIFPRCTIDRNVETNEVEFSVWNGCEIYGEG